MKKFAFALAAATVLLASNRAPADPIVTTFMSGTNANYSLSESGSLATLTLNASNVNVINNGTGYAIPTVFLSLTFDRTPTSTDASGTHYQFDPTTIPNGETIQFSSANAVFKLTGASILVAPVVIQGGFVDVLTLQGNLQLTSVPSLYDNGGPTFDLSPFRDPSSTFNIVVTRAGENINSDIANGTTLIGSSAFSEVSPVPEPSSMVLLGMGSLGMFGYTWRRRSRLVLA